jgi:hypothetical protein
MTILSSNRRCRPGGAAFIAISVVCCACGGAPPHSADDAGDSGATIDGGLDGGSSDGGLPIDGGADAGLDGGTSDGGNPDGGLPDSGPPVDAGPWPVQIPLDGCGVNYTTTVTIGGSQSFTFILDTGSATMAVGGSSCQSCIDGGVTPLYTPGADATDRHTTAQSAYGDTSSWAGEIYQDTVSIGSLQPVTVDFADIETQMNFFAYQDYWCRASISGILGFGPRALLVSGTTSYFDQVADAGVPDVFSFQLCPSGGTLWLGGVDAQFVPQYTPMVSHQGFYTVVVSSIDVGGQSLGLPPGNFGNAFVDTGGQALWLPPTAFNAVVNALGNDTSFTSLLGDAKAFFSQSTYCVHLSQSAAELDAMLPPLTLTFGSGITLQSPATSSYLYDLPGCGYMPAMFTRGSAITGLPPIELGAPILKNKVVVIDRAQQQVGFVTAPCQ